MDDKNPIHDERPWGTFTVLDEGPGYKVKRIVVRPGHRLSYQVHRRRQEHWVVVAGSALVVLDGVDHELEVGDTIDVPVETAHRIANPGDVDMVFIEVQRGDYLGEDDIVRLQDDYARVEG
ncbi:MAG: phosphomannose isomerase type II C-terminal cupin domain [Acidimicrobiia bacterium]|nr:phosphomannose isomerase type II C-terminal cupin domain [Acidimicrobiia bacterium]